MKEVYVVYWSSTGNTQAMAEAVGAGINEAGGTARVVEVSSVQAPELENQACFALGASAMGAEELDGRWMPLSQRWRPLRQAGRSPCSAPMTGVMGNGCEAGQTG